MTVSEELSVPLPTVPELAVEGRSGENSSWLFLSLYLLMFAFFMVLNSFSSFESGKKDAVISSVLSAFSKIASPGEDVQTGGFVSLDPQSSKFQDAVTNIFETAIPLTKIRVVVPGSRLDVDLPSQVFFADDSVVVRDPLPVLDRIVATVSSPPQGVLYEVAVIGYVPLAGDEPLTTAMTSQVARVGNIARALNAKGMPPAAVTIGLERGTQKQIKLVFFAVEDVLGTSPSMRLWGGEAT